MDETEKTIYATAFAIAFANRYETEPESWPTNSMQADQNSIPRTKRIARYANLVAREAVKAFKTLGA